MSASTAMLRLPQVSQAVLKGSIGRCALRHAQKQVSQLENLPCASFGSLTFTSVFSSENKKKCIETLQQARSIRLPRSDSTKRQAAVLIPLCVVGNEPSLLFTLRSPHLRSHRGQVSFPGGLAETADENLIGTATREMEEELGISPSRVEIWTEFAPISDKSGRIIINPVLAYVGDIRLAELRINPAEVEVVFTRQLESLCLPENKRYTQFRKGGYALPLFLGGEHRIWGATAILTHQVLSALMPNSYGLKIPFVRPYHPSKQ